MRGIEKKRKQGQATCYDYTEGKGTEDQRNKKQTNPICYG
jgi:hypothetical protein